MTAWGDYPNWAGEVVALCPRFLQCSRGRVALRAAAPKHGASDAKARSLWGAAEDRASPAGVVLGRVAAAVAFVLAEVLSPQLDCEAPKVLRGCAA